MVENINSQKWWSEAKRRAYTYREKKINRLSGYDLYLELRGESYTVESIREILEEKGYVGISERRFNKIKKIMDDELNKENYLKTLGDDADCIDPFCHMVILRDHMPHRLTNTEAWAYAVNYLFLWLAQIKRTKPPRGETIDFIQDEIYTNLFNDMHVNWIYYMDSVDIVQGKINALVAGSKTP